MVSWIQLDVGVAVEYYYVSTQTKLEWWYSTTPALSIHSYKSSCKWYTQYIPGKIEQESRRNSREQVCFIFPAILTLAHCNMINISIHTTCTTHLWCGWCWSWNVSLKGDEWSIIVSESIKLKSFFYTVASDCIKFAETVCWHRHSILRLFHVLFSRLCLITMLVTHFLLGSWLHNVPDNHVCNMII